MTCAVITGALSSGFITPSQVTVATPSPTKLAGWSAGNGVKVVDSNQEACLPASVIVLGVKPHVVPTVMAELAPALGSVSQKLVVSMAAGVSTSSLHDLLPSARVVRVMPNTPAAVQCAASAVCGGPGATEEDLSLVLSLFGALGTALEVKESAMDGVTGLSGSGPAFVFMMLEAMADGGVAMGLPRSTAMALAARTVQGAATMVLETQEHPGVLKDAVASPGGTTIAGISALERRGFRGTVLEAVVAAGKRSKELAQQ